MSTLPGEARTFGISTKISCHSTYGYFLVIRERIENVVEVEVVLLNVLSQVYLVPKNQFRWSASKKFESYFSSLTAKF